MRDAGKERQTNRFTTETDVWTDADHVRTMRALHSVMKISGTHGQTTVYIMPVMCTVGMPRHSKPYVSVDGTEWMPLWHSGWNRPMQTQMPFPNQSQSPTFATTTTCIMAQIAYTHTHTHTHELSSSLLLLLADNEEFGWESRPLETIIIMPGIRLSHLQTWKQQVNILSFCNSMFSIWKGM